MREDFHLDKIDSFWDWFSAQEEHTRQVLEGRSEQAQEALVQAFNNQVLALGLFTWELGRGQRRPFYFTISPNGSRELLEHSRQLMEAAPRLPQWEFHHAKPPQEWDLKFRLYDEDYNERDVDASRWKFRLQEHPQGGALILLEAANIGHLDGETKLTATEQVVMSLLGEEQKILHVAEIRILTQLSSGSTPIQQLRERFEAFLF
ncbi:hypothetical protein ADICEAN_02739 [Cesiribacter andamanensis AMV16]|uniref:DUF695 domain-containing protein n=2 Tax=Cesiribacter TaxID=1133570 RepID=M7N0A4_9BACT|nr:hypothetical protein ADICEAN_02739 [Cesiribacter andamanensis AMV16]